MKKANREWKIDSWRDYKIKQQPNYENSKELKRVENILKQSPSLVYFDEVMTLRKKLAEVCEGNAFLLQGGDCAESFAEFNEKNLINYFKVILQMTVALMHGAGKPVVKVGRIAGQFSKPRSSDYEKIGDRDILSYRGDMINRIEATDEARVANPLNLLEAYKQSGVTLNFLRSLASGGFASLDNINKWMHDFAKNSGNAKLKEIIPQIEESISFFKACGFNLSASKDYNSANFYTSHEGLLLNYEESLTRFNKVHNKYYCGSAHMLWIGDRTRNIDEAHIEYMRGIYNPIASKISPSIKKKELLKLIEILNPNNEPGRLTLISRMGADKINDYLPEYVEAVKKAGLNVIWSCDPMHGNTEKSSTGYKTRRFGNILSEVKSFFNIHKKLGTYAGGIHIEMTGQNVTECLGGAQEIKELHLKDRYNTHCDPRLNAAQSVELSFLIAQTMK